MIRQIRFLKGECGWVNFPDGTIKRVVNGNEVINVSSFQTEGLTDVTHTSAGEKDHSCAFEIMQQLVSEQGSAKGAHRGHQYTVGKHDRQTECTHYRGSEKVEHFHNFPGRLKEHALSFGKVHYAWRFLSILIYFLERPSKHSLTNLGMRSFHSVCVRFV